MNPVVVAKKIHEKSGVDPDEFLSKNRSQRCLKPRWALWIILRDASKYSYPAIGKLCKYDHTTVMHGITRGRKSQECMRLVRECLRELSDEESQERLVKGVFLRSDVSYGPPQDTGPEKCLTALEASARAAMEAFKHGQLISMQQAIGDCLVLLKDVCRRSGYSESQVLKASRIYEEPKEIGVLQDAIKESI